MVMNNPIQYRFREEGLFAGIRKPIKNRSELIPRMEQVKKACEGVATGPLTHIFRFDTPVDGFDSEIGFPVTTSVRMEEMKTSTLRRLDTFSLLHSGSLASLRDTTRKIYAHMNKVGLAAELELVEIYHKFDPEDQDDVLIEVQASFLNWPEVYYQQLVRVLGYDLASKIWAGGEEITPFTLVDDRVEWVGKSLVRLKEYSNQDQQFDILSRVALVRPSEDINKFKKIYEETGDVNVILAMQNEQLESGPTGGFIDPHWFDGATLHLSKVAYDRKAYDAATTQDEVRKAYCFCTLIRESKAPEVDPIFCYRAAGWARQFWEPILGVDFKTCSITHSILKGDKFCAWDYALD
jgi:effector-binding domain-containing protein